ncbi:MAG TPA: hypothetical protein VN253_27515 [Kofleriaceae bacterium]|nr:hypothetical protein [Kofleriaceae bacterium]
MTRPVLALWKFLTRERALPFARRGVAPAKRPVRRARRKQRGVAIITVLIAITLTLVMTNQFGTSTTVDLIAAANYRDQMRAHFLARSAVNLSELVIRLQQKLDSASSQKGLEFLKGVQITDFANQVMLAFCGNPEEVHAAIGDAASLSKGLGADIGTCGVVGSITTDDDKINVNCANDPRSAPILKSELDALFFFNAYDPVFEEADAQNWRRDRALQVSAILDYIDRDNSRGVADAKSAGTTEDYGYESLKDHYRPKNTYIDTVGELKLVRGVDDRFWTLFGKAFTVYGACTMNLSSITNVQLIAAILYLSAKNPSDPVLQDPQKLFALAGIVAKAKQFGMQFGKAEDFVDFVKDPGAAVGALAGSGGMAGSQATDALNAGIPGLTGGQKLGMELDAAKIKAIATTGPRRTYRVEAWGEIDRKARDANNQPVFPPIRSTITGVWDTRPVNQNVRKQPALKGTWVFLRED